MGFISKDAHANQFSLSAAIFMKVKENIFLEFQDDFLIEGNYEVNNYAK